MRRSVLLPLLLFSLVAVLALLIPTATAIAESRTRGLVLARQSATEHLARTARAAIEGESIELLQQQIERHAEVYGEPALVLDADGAVIATTGAISATQPDVIDVVDASADTLPRWNISTITPWGPARALVAEPVLGGIEQSVGTVVVEARLDRAQREIVAAWGVSAAAAAALLAGLMLIALRWTNSVLRPVRALDEASRTFPPRHDVAHFAASGPPELRSLAVSFGQMAEGVERALAQQRVFVADASHQLRNPLAAIRLRLDAMSLGTHTADDLRKIDADTERLEHFVDRMLTLAGVEHRAITAASGTEPAVSRTHLVPSAAGLIAPHLALHAARGQTLIASGGPVTVNCARSDLEEMLDLALDNARNYAGDGTRVEVRLRRDGAWVELTVTDNGPGLSTEDLVRAQSRFWRGTGGETTPGTGLGLSILTELAHANGGTISVFQAPEGGLGVTIRLQGGGVRP